MNENKLLITALAPFYRKGALLTDVILRMLAGGALAAHGAQKLFGWFDGRGLEATAGLMAQIGFGSGELAALAAGIVEFFGGLLLVLGLCTRPAAVACTILLAVVLYVLYPRGFFWSQGGYEYALIWTFLCLAFVFKGGGPYSIDALVKKEL